MILGEFTTPKLTIGSVTATYTKHLRYEEVDCPYSSIIPFKYLIYHSKLKDDVYVW